MSTKSGSDTDLHDKYPKYQCPFNYYDPTSSLSELYVKSPKYPLNYYYDDDSKNKFDACSTETLGFNLVSEVYQGRRPFWRPILPLCYYGDDDEPRFDDKQMFIDTWAPLYLRITSIEGTIFRLQDMWCRESEVLKNYILDSIPSSSRTYFVSLTSYILEKVLYFLETYVQLQHKLSVSDAFNKTKDFFKQNHTLLFEIMKAARLLQIRSLFDLTSVAIVEMITGKTDEHILKIMNLKSGFTIKEVEEIHRKEGWAFRSAQQEKKAADEIYFSWCSTEVDKDEMIHFSFCSTEADNINWVKTAFFVQHVRECIEDLKPKENPDRILWTKDKWKRFTRIHTRSCILRMSPTKSDER